MELSLWLNGVVTFVVGLVALMVYWLQRRAERRGAAIILIMDIRHAERVIGDVLQRNTFDRYMGNIQGAKNWDATKHIFVSSLSTDDLVAFNKFFLACSEISDARTDMRSIFMASLTSKCAVAQERLCSLDPNDPDYVRKRNEIIGLVETDSYFFNPADPIDRVVKNIQVMGRLTHTPGFRRLKKIAGMND